MLQQQKSHDESRIDIEENPEKIHVKKYLDLARSAGSNCKCQFLFKKDQLPGASSCDLHLGVLFVTFSGVVGDLHLGNQKVTLKKLVDW